MPKLPAFESAEELADFVDTHDMAPYWEDLVSVDSRSFRVVRGKQTAMRVPLSLSTAERLKALAAKRGLSASELVRRWVKEQLKRETGNP